MKKFCLLLLFSIVTLFVYSQIPSVIIKNIEGKNINTGTLKNNNKPFIISFFALWCKPCLRELNAISEVYEEWQKETGVKIFAISIDDGQNTDRVAPAVNGYGWNYEVLLDNNKEFMRAMNVTLIPCIFIVDSNNKIVLRKSSYTDGSEQELIEKIKELLKKK